MDQGLVEAAQHGDRDAFADLMRSVGDGLYALAYRILRDPHLAQDAFQEASIAAWRQLPNLRDPERFEAWMHRILVHACYAESRKRTRWTSNIRMIDIDEDPSVDRAPTILDRDELERGFARLSLDHRAVFVMHHYIGLSLVEISERLGIPAGTARSRLHYAAHALREALGEDAALQAQKERLA
ncbi:sigma-70 family RNA polymerase sigma factor [soil metagenome]